MNKIIIKLFDNAFGHEIYCGHKLGRNESKNITWDRSRQVEKNDIVVFTDSCLNYVETIKVPCKKIAWLIEPPAVQSSNYTYIKNNWSKFDLILTHQEDLLNISEKFRISPMWYSMVFPEKQKITTKNKLLSIISSNKRETIGQKLRHDVIKSIRNKIDIDLFGGLTSHGGYNPIVDKSEGLSPYMFSIVIENAKSPHYFSEKIIDCLLCGTVPIYWGAQKIGDYFQTEGFITFDTIDDLEKLLPSFNEETYKNMYKFVEQNFITASKFTTVEDYIYENFLNKI